MTRLWVGPWLHLQSLVSRAQLGPFPQPAHLTPGRDTVTSSTARRPTRTVFSRGPAAHLQAVLGVENEAY